MNKIAINDADLIAAWLKQRKIICALVVHFTTGCIKSMSDAEIHDFHTSLGLTTIDDWFVLTGELKELEDILDKYSNINMPYISLWENYVMTDSNK